MTFFFFFSVSLPFGLRCNRFPHFSQIYIKIPYLGTYKNITLYCCSHRYWRAIPGFRVLITSTLHFVILLYHLLCRSSSHLEAHVGNTIAAVWILIWIFFFSLSVRNDKSGFEIVFPLPKLKIQIMLEMRMYAFLY